MLDAYIIEQLRKREEERRRHEERPHLELPIYPEPPPDKEVEEKPEPARVIVIDL